MGPEDEIIEVETDADAYLYFEKGVQGDTETKEGH